MKFISIFEKYLYVIILLSTSGVVFTMFGDCPTKVSIFSGIIGKKQQERANVIIEQIEAFKKKYNLTPVRAVGSSKEWLKNLNTNDYLLSLKNAIFAYISEYEKNKLYDFNQLNRYFILFLEEFKKIQQNYVDVLEKYKIIPKGAQRALDSDKILRLLLFQLKENGELSKYAAKVSKFGQQFKKYPVMCQYTALLNELTQQVQSYILNKAYELRFK